MRPAEAPSFDLDRYLELHRPHVESALERAVQSLESRLVEPEVAGAVRHGVLSGGKRLRPILCVTAYRACGGVEGPAVYDLAASVELIHAYSLMHDDLPCMDDAALRRGRPTTHRVHGEDVTMRAGAALIPGAALQALEAARALGCDEETSREVVLTLLEAAGAGGMVGGQWLDLLGEDRLLAPEALDELHGRKTGALLAASLRMGAVAAGAGQAVRAALLAYGRSIGLAFQIADDILDATQTPATLGKNPSDADRGKSTYPGIHGLDAARALARSQVEAARAALREGGVAAPELEALADFVVERES